MSNILPVQKQLAISARLYLHLPASKQQEFHSPRSVVLSNGFTSWGIRGFSLPEVLGVPGVVLSVVVGVVLVEVGATGVLARLV